MGDIEKTIQAAYWAADSDQVGYSQPDRESLTVYDFYGDGLYNTDCSIFDIRCLNYGGFDTAWASYTGNMLGALLSSGFTAIKPNGNPQPGWVLLNESDHAALMVHDGNLAEASISEHGTIDGARGDQTGWEVHTQPYYDYPWDWYLIPPEDEPEPEQEAGDPVNDAGLYYRVHAQNLGWLLPVRDGQAAGTTGYGLRMEGLKITPPEGWVLYAKAHIQNVGWVNYPDIKRGEGSGEGSSPNDPIIGSTGKGLRIEGIIIGVSERPAGDNRKLYFQVHQENTGWKGWTEEGYASGTDGMALRLEAIRMKIE